MEADCSKESTQPFSQPRFPRLFTFLAILSGHTWSGLYPSPTMPGNQTQSCTHVLRRGLGPLPTFDLHSPVRAFKLHFWDISLDTISQLVVASNCEVWDHALESLADHIPSSGLATEGSSKPETGKSLWLNCKDILPLGEQKGQGGLKKL